MESQSPNKRSLLSDPTWRRWMIAIGIVWMVLALIYAIQAIQIRKKQKTLTTNGVTMVQAFSEQAGLPLLEQDINKLRNMLTDIGKQPDVLHATVIDHKNKIIAFTDAGQLLPPPKVSVLNDGGVETWLDNDAMIFSNAIMFSGTPIGEIRLAFTRASIVKSKRIFAVIAAISLTGLTLSWLFLHGTGLVAKVKNRIGKTCSIVGDQLMHCPLCGQDVENSGSFCHAVHGADHSIVFKLTGAFRGKDGSPGLQLSEIGSNPDLAPVKGQLIRQCAEIIGKLSASEGVRGSRAGRTHI